MPVRPGPSSFSAASSSAAGLATSTAPSVMPATAAGTATSADSTACCAAIRPGPKPSARWTPRPVRRRWTSACAPAASIVPAASSATNENATSSEITIPAACDRRISTPVRVMNCSLPRPNVTARAWASVTSAFSGSASHSSATFGRTRPRCSARVT